ncbi:MAG: UdgX family uracil-DNA binding protein, partial [Proteobacteria bacterium]|nr:UdgX family uracil-DNA binding protein [Pseudomonadota bacterium]
VVPLLGPAALGLLTSREQEQLDRHLRTCAGCREELAALTGVARRLGDLDAESALAGPPGGVADLVLARVSRERRRAQRLQGLVAAAASVAVLLAGLVTAGALTEDAPEVPMEAVAVQADRGVDATANLVAHTWGVEIKLVAAGLADGRPYTVQVRTERGELVDAGAFLGTGERTLSCNLNASVLREDAASFSVRDAGGRVRDMAEREPQAPRRRIPQRRIEAVPQEDGGLAAARALAADCRQCPLWEPATQTVWGEGPEDARLMFIGEQPGDAEDLTGRPFVGPAGALLDRAFADAGIDRAAVYLTNAVKHFRFQQRGKVRLHQRPDAGHVHACHAWLQREIGTVRPDAIVCLGATAAAAVFGAGFRLTGQRGAWHTLGNGVRAMATVHPAWVLRQPAAAQAAAYRGLVEDLRAGNEGRAGALEGSG